MNKTLIIIISILATTFMSGIADGYDKTPPPTYFPITPDFNATTADVDVTRYVKVSIVLTYTYNAKQLAVELSEKVYMIKDIIYAIIKTYTFDQLRTNEGIEQLKNDIKSVINAFLKTGKIDDVLFVDLTLN